MVFVNPAGDADGFKTLLTVERALPKLSATRMRISATILATALIASLTARVRGELADAIEAVVHDSVITYEEVEGLTDQTSDVLRRDFRYQPELLQKKMDELRSANLEKLLDRQLILHDFKTGGYNLPESVIDELVQERIRGRYGDRATLTKTLQAQGMSYEKFRQQVREQFIVEVMRQKNISSEVIISPHKVEVYYQEHQQEFKEEDKVKVRMIVLKQSSDPEAPQARKMAEEILAKIKAGASFDEMAKEVDLQRSQRNPEGEWFDKTQLRKELADAAFSLKKGETSEVIETPEACYLIHVEDTKAAHFKPISEARDSIERDLLTHERARLEKQWMERLKKTTFVRSF